MHDHNTKLKGSMSVVSFINILVCIFTTVRAASRFNSEWAQGFHNMNYNNYSTENKGSAETPTLSLAVRNLGSS